jgi:hypothetical protein
VAGRGTPFVEQRLGEPEKQPLFDTLSAMSDPVHIRSILFQAIPIPVVNSLAAPTAELSNGKGHQTHKRSTSEVQRLPSRSNGPVATTDQ